MQLLKAILVKQPDMAFLPCRECFIRCSGGRTAFTDAKPSVLIESQLWLAVVSASGCLGVHRANQ